MEGNTANILGSVEAFTVLALWQYKLGKNFRTLLRSTRKEDQNITRDTLMPTRETSNTETLIGDSNEIGTARFLFSHTLRLVFYPKLTDLV